MPYKNNLVLLIIGLTIAMTVIIFAVPMFSKFFLFEKIAIKQIVFSLLVGFVAVKWIEIYKIFKRRKSE